MKKIMAVAAIGLLFLIPVTGWAEVRMRIAWQLGAPLQELQAVIKEGKALQKKINPRVKHELFVNALHGENVNSASLVVIYNDLEHYAKATAREQASKEWGEFISRFPADKFSTSFVGLSNTLVGAGQEPAKGGEALQIPQWERLA